MSEHAVRHRGRKAAAATLIAAAALGLVACNDTESDAADAPPAAAGPDATHADTASYRTGSHGTGPDQGGSDGADGAPAAPERCTTAHLKAGWGSQGDDAPDMKSGQQQSAEVRLTNTGGSSCTLSGFPGVRIEDADGDSADLPRSSQEPVTVTLKPGGDAAFTIRLLPSQSDGSRTIEPGRVLITPPDEERPFALRWSYGGAIVDQSNATHPGTFVTPVDVS